MLQFYSRKNLLLSFINTDTVEGNISKDGVRRIKDGVLCSQGTEMRQLEFAQRMIQSDTHQGRLEYFKDILDEEYRACIAKKSLKNL